MGGMILAVNVLFTVYYFLLILRAVLPWIAQSRSNPWSRFVGLSTDWLLNPIRAGLPPEKIGMDVSPYVAIVLLYLIQRFFFSY